MYEQLEHDKHKYTCGMNGEFFLLKKLERSNLSNIHFKMTKFMNGCAFDNGVLVVYAHVSKFNKLNKEP